MICQSLHLAKSLSFTDKSLKMGMMSVNGLIENWRLRTKWSKSAVCPYKFSRFDLVFTDKCSKKPALSVNHHHNGQKFTDKSAQNGTLSVNLNEILAESLSSTAFRSAGQNQSQIDRLRSVFHLIQARNGTFSQPLFVWKM